MFFSKHPFEMRDKREKADRFRGGGGVPVRLDTRRLNQRSLVIL